MTCAACHEGQLKYKGKLIRIEGGISNTFNFQGLASGISEALLRNLTDAAKFDRLASRIRATTPDAKDKLRKRIESERARVHEYATRTSITPHPWGPGRVDALTMIVDRTTATLSGNSRELVDGKCAGQASLPLECSARTLDAVECICSRIR